MPGEVVRAQSILADVFGNLFEASLRCSLGPRRSVDAAVRRPGGNYTLNGPVSLQRDAEAAINYIQSIEMNSGDLEWTSLESALALYRSTTTIGVRRRLE